MRLSTKSEYACLALFDLSANYGKELVKIQDIALRQKIPRKYLERILLILRDKGYLESRRGASGGYRLSKHPSNISVAEVVRLMDGPIAPVKSVSTYFYKHTPIEENHALKALFKEVRDLVAGKMEHTTFQSLLTKK